MRRRVSRRPDCRVTAHFRCAALLRYGNCRLSVAVVNEHYAPSVLVGADVHDGMSSVDGLGDRHRFEHVTGLVKVNQFHSRFLVSEGGAPRRRWLNQG